MTPTFLIQQIKESTDLELFIGQRIPGSNF
jgi:hypothetical protein